MTIFESFSQSDTEELGRKMGRAATGGEVYALVGGLAAGKTAFARGFARGLGIDADITSPTFGIVNEYRHGSLPLYHFDVYRIKHIQEMEDTGYEDYFWGGGISLVEWADIIRELLPPSAVFVRFECDIDRGEDYRRIEVGI
ncbi:MAG: tRNA (adenosine(37)-N6)-threonylcarbamoyltransferase complex ATPase subunit type 1 TsaE [Clostridiales bacterium]|jgi:tRNA threonylcarbamoyladenosine biosynthesis protein TsaE|nr:tRNA (adenosine(37)-N6)-threonylcarbamoyltransferase complex ATPase subunit type 1 TsaE [Clostridiales bacterium]